MGNLKAFTTARRYQRWDKVGSFNRETRGKKSHDTVSLATSISAWLLNPISHYVGQLNQHIFVGQYKKYFQVKI